MTVTIRHPHSLTKVRTTCRSYVVGTKIEWTDETWNPVIGCTKVSAGCEHCYAARIAWRLAHMKATAERYKGLVNKSGWAARLVTNECWTGRVRCLESELARPLRWRKPRMVFVCSMGDLFHPEVPFEFIDRVFAVMAMSPKHTFQLLTKRAEQLDKYIRYVAQAKRSYWCGEFGYLLNSLIGAEGSIPWDIRAASARMREHYYPDVDPKSLGDSSLACPWPLPNVWLGVSVEDPNALYRLDHLVKTPAAKRFVSCEPLLEEIDLAPWIGPYWCDQCERHYLYPADKVHCPNCGEDEVRGPGDVEPPCSHCEEPDSELICPGCGVDGGNGGLNHNECGMRDRVTPTLNQVIVGCETGPGARPMDLDWVRSLRDECRAADGVSFFLKQMMINGRRVPCPELDGRQWMKMPK